VGVMARMNARVACTPMCLGGTEGGGIGDGLVSRRGAWRIRGFTGGTLDGRMVGGALGIQFMATIQCHHRCHHWKGCGMGCYCVYGADGPTASI
jgi:hypothetical protein